MTTIKLIKRDFTKETCHFSYIKIRKEIRIYKFVEI